MAEFHDLYKYIIVPPAEENESTAIGTHLPESVCLRDVYGSGSHNSEEQTSETQSDGEGGGRRGGEGGGGERVRWRTREGASF